MVKDRFCEVRRLCNVIVYSRVSFAHKSCRRFASAIGVLPMARFSFRQPCNRRCQTLRFGFIAFRLRNPIHILLLVAVAETLKSRRSLLVLFERSAELRWNRQIPGTFRLGFGRLLYAFIV